jgi:3'(2'), 5'-bisphosphate nucleotidase
MSIGNSGEKIEMDEQELLRVFRRLAIEAGEIIMAVYHADDLGVEAKADESPVTIADKRADAHISAGLRAAFPDIPLVTEEQAASHGLDATTFLIVDPLDGTKEFINRRTDFTVNIALVEDGVPVHGVVYAPARGRLFITKPGGGAMEEQDPTGDKVGQGRDIRVSDQAGGPLRVVASKSHRDQATDDVIARHDVSEVVSAGSSLKFCLVAAGEADFYPRLGPTMEWDIAAGHAVVRAAGGRVTLPDASTPMRYGKAGYRNGPFFVFAEGAKVVGSP